MTVSTVLDHLYMVLAAATLSITIGLPLGLLAYLKPKFRSTILRIVDLFQTVPSMALLGLIMIVLGAGKITVIVGITLYALLPVVRNTCLGLQEVDAGVKEAARGMGMSTLYRTMVIEFPLAFPTVFTGIRIAVVNAISTAVFAAFVGGGGLGVIIVQGIRTQNMTTILTATGALMIIAIILDGLMSFLESRMKDGRGDGARRAMKVIAPIMVIILITLPLGLTTTYADNEIITYDGTYTTDQIGPRILKYYLEAHTDLVVTIQDTMSSVNRFNEFINNPDTCNILMTYDGTVLTTYMHQDTADVPDGMTLYDYTNEYAMEHYGMMMTGKLGFENTYAVAVPETVAESYGLETISDLIPVANELTFGAEHEFFTEEGSIKYNPFCEFYGLEFASASSVDISIKYSAVATGSFDVTEVYTSDGLNRQANLFILEDDQEFFPEYYTTYLVYEDFYEQYYDIAPDLEELMEALCWQFTDDEIVDIGYAVDVLGEDLDQIIIECLESKGLI